MRKILHEITSQSEVGIFGKQPAAALIYADKITVSEPYAQITDGNGILAFRVTCIRNQSLVNQVTADIVDNRQGDAWYKVRHFMEFML